MNLHVSPAQVLRYTAFTAEPSGGNPAGIVLDADEIDEAAMLSIAADVGFSETVFAILVEARTLKVRYFSPLAEVPFCGHATIALAVAIAHRDGVGQLSLHTKAGRVSVETTVTAAGSILATLVSVPPRTSAIADDALTQLLAALRWPREDLDPLFPPRAAYAGAWHPIIAAATRGRLASLDYDMEAMRVVMDQHSWATINLVWPESVHVYHARNPFPPGGVWEDPATGAAAAAFGGYLRELSLVSPPTSITILQGQDMGRPSQISVKIPVDPASGIAVSGTAVPLQ